MPGPATISKSISGFDPRSVPGCVLWLDGADTSTLLQASGASVTTTGQSVSTWKDKSGNGYNATANGTAATNGTNYVIFAGAQNYGTSLSSTMLTQSGFAVISYTGSAKMDIISVNSTSGTAGLQQIINAGSQIITSYGGATVVTGSAVSASTVLLYNYTFNSGVNAFIYLNGTQTGTSSGAAISGSGTISIGSYNNNGGLEPFTGNMYEILLYNQVLSTSQRQAIEGYLAWKWGIQTVSTKNLITTHPFYYNRVFSRGFQPVDIPGCMIWLDGADTTTMTPTIPSSGTSITAWQDKACLMYSTGTIAYSFTPGAIQKASSNGTVYTEASPTYVTGGGLLFSNSTGLLGNGQQGLGLYSTNLNSSPLFTMPTQAMTIAIASYPLSNNSYRRLAALGSYQLGGAYLPNFFIGPEMGTSEGGTLLYDFNGSAWGQANYGTTGYNSTAALRVDVMISGPGASQWWWTNGTLNTFNTSNVYTSAYSNYPVNFFLIGSYTNTIDGNRNFHGNIYEVLLYNTALTISQRQQVEGYLSQKWGFRTSLIAGHPYRTIPPSSALPFTPTSITGCQLWFDASDTSTVTLNGSTVSSWNDKSGYGYSVGQSTVANQPAYATRLLNGLPGIQLAYTKYLSQLGSNISSFASSTATTVFMVAKNGSTYPTDGWNIINTLWFNTTRYHFSFGIGAVNGVALYANGAQIGQTTAVALGSNAMIGFSLSSTASYINVNGTLTNYGGVTLPNAANSTLFNFGDSRSGPGLVFVADLNIYEFIGYTTTLTTTQRQQVEGYLAWKWGLQTSLPSSHPYYKINPVQGYLT